MEKIIKIENVYMGNKKVVVDEEMFLNELDKIGIKACKKEIKNNEKFYFYLNKKIFKKN